MVLVVVVGPKPAASAKIPSSTPAIAKLWATVAASHAQAQWVKTA